MDSCSLNSNVGKSPLDIALLFVVMPTNAQVDLLASSHFVKACHLILETKLEDDHLKVG